MKKEIKKIAISIVVLMVTLINVGAEQPQTTNIPKVIVTSLRK